MQCIRVFANCDPAMMRYAPLTILCGSAMPLAVKQLKRGEPNDGHSMVVTALNQANPSLDKDAMAITITIHFQTFHSLPTQSFTLPAQ